ncbi:MAG: hypothetical protein K8Q91_02450 [Candidatus Vogelbacteria bacterium]|nr:hypothetical protein [Candidatus Vogelbacteria bacterium]
MKEISLFAIILTGISMIPPPPRGLVSDEKRLRPVTPKRIRPVVEILGTNPPNDGQYDRLGRQKGRTKKGDSQ